MAPTQPDLDPALLCVASKIVINKVPKLVLVPTQLRHVGKKPFRLVDGKLFSRDRITLQV
jgi:hypothetical protein